MEITVQVKRLIRSYPTFDQWSQFSFDDRVASRTRQGESIEIDCLGNILLNHVAVKACKNWPVRMYALGEPWPAA